MNALSSEIAMPSSQLLLFIGWDSTEPPHSLVIVTFLSYKLRRIVSTETSEDFVSIGHGWSLTKRLLKEEWRFVNILN
ncbi:hypothetical protein HMPREF2140_09615 [Hoylesella buccalis DNF00985]|nr:hypothetical protein HMPREF2140_09615 [Hoylesella buccalis DNF00985]